jgi:hypothetical protein
VTISPSQWSETDGAGIWHARYRVRTYKNEQLESDEVRVMMISTRSTQSRLGAEDGVEIFGFSDPIVEQSMRQVAGIQPNTPR